MPTRISFCDSVSTRIRTRTTFSPSSSTSAATACGTSSRVRCSAFSRTSSAICISSGRVRRASSREVAPGPRAGARRGRSAARRSRRAAIALTGCSAWKSPSAAAAFICEMTCAGFRRSILLSAMITGTPSEKTRRATKRSPPPIRSRALRTRSTASVSSSAVSTALCMCSVSGSSGRCTPGQIRQDELRVRLVDDAEDPPPRRVRLVRDDRDLAAAERVHERRLADVRPSRDGHEARPHQSSNAAGSSSSGVQVTRFPSGPG